MTSSLQFQSQTPKQFGQLFYQYIGSRNNNNQSNGNSNSNMEQQTKKRCRRRVLSLKERIEVIKIAETRRDTRDLALKFDCGRTQILSILSQKERLLREWANNGDPNRLRRRPSAMSMTTNKVIYEWMNRCKCAQMAISDNEILEKAHEAKNLFKYSEFRPNRRWLDRFKRKFRIKREDLVAPDPVFYDGVERSLDLKDIFEEIKHTIEVTSTDELPTIHDQNESTSLESMTNFEQMIDRANDMCEIINDSDDQSYSPHYFCETELSKEEEEEAPASLEEEFEEEIKNDKPIINNKQALECLKKLEEYSMLKDDFRAIGLIVQLEKIYKGQEES